ncbi:MAG: ATP-binding protein [Pseudomonadota bacterium]
MHNHNRSTDHRIDWAVIPGALWRSHRQQLKPVPALDPVRLDDLLGIEQQKHELVTNTERFMAGLPANNALLWGARGTGKSSLVKAVANAFTARGLRIVQVDRDDLILLPEIVDQLRDQPYHFVIFCDDLSFAAGDAGYRALKTVLEGSIEAPAGNVRIYATSNRRHLVPEYLADNEQSRVSGTEIHHGDEVEEKISLADRFGLWLSFYPIDQESYLAIVDHLFAGSDGDLARNDRSAGLDGHTGRHAEALRFAQTKGVRSGRTARQFFNACHKS